MNYMLEPQRVVEEDGEKTSPHGGSSSLRECQAGRNSQRTTMKYCFLAAGE